MNGEELVKRLREWWNYDTGRLFENAITHIEALTADFVRQAQRTDEQREAYEQALSVMEADNERLREALMDAREAWDNHMEYGEPMQGWWVADARSALKGESHE